MSPNTESTTEVNVTGSTDEFTISKRNDTSAPGSGTDDTPAVFVTAIDGNTSVTSTSSSSDAVASFCSSSTPVTTTVFSCRSPALPPTNRTSSQVVDAPGATTTPPRAHSAVMSPNTESTTEVNVTGSTDEFTISKRNDTSAPGSGTDDTPAVLVTSRPGSTSVTSTSSSSDAVASFCSSSTPVTTTVFSCRSPALPPTKRTRSQVVDAPGANTTPPSAHSAVTSPNTESTTEVNVTGSTDEFTISKRNDTSAPGSGTDDTPAVFVTPIVGNTSVTSTSSSSDAVASFCSSSTALNVTTSPTTSPALPETSSVNVQL